MPSLKRSHPGKKKRIRKQKNRNLYNSVRWRGKRKAGQFVGGLRADKLLEDPFDEVFLSIGVPRRGAHVDHIIPIEFGGSFGDLENLMTLTSFMHSIKTGIEMGKGEPLIKTKPGSEGLIPYDRSEIIDILKPYAIKKYPQIGGGNEGGGFA